MQCVILTVLGTLEIKSRLSVLISGEVKMWSSSVRVSEFVATASVETSNKWWQRPFVGIICVSQSRAFVWNSNDFFYYPWRDTLFLFESETRTQTFPIIIKISSRSVIISKIHENSLRDVALWAKLYLAMRKSTKMRGLRNIIG